MGKNFKEYIKNHKTPEEWEKIGLLIGIDINKHATYVNLFNIGVNHVLNKDSEYSESYESVFLPIIRRISDEIMMTEEQTIEMLDELNENCKEIDEILNDKTKRDDYQKLGVDVELEFVKKFAEEKIKELKKKD